MCQLKNQIWKIVFCIFCKVLITIHTILTKPSINNFRLESYFILASWYAKCYYTFFLLF